MRGAVPHRLPGRDQERQSLWWAAWNGKIRRIHNRKTGHFTLIVVWSIVQLHDRNASSAPETDVSSFRRFTLVQDSGHRSGSHIADRVEIVALWPEVRAEGSWCDIQPKYVGGDVVAAICAKYVGVWRCHSVACGSTVGADCHIVVRFPPTRRGIHDYFTPPTLRWKHVPREADYLVLLFIFREHRSRGELKHGHVEVTVHRRPVIVGILFVGLGSQAEE